MVKPISVLIVDDSALMRKLISRIFENDEGFEIAATAMNGEFALRKLERLEVHCIILDLEMPEMNGIEFLKARNKLGIDIPVIILSSVAEKGAKITMDALALGAADFILKPSGSISQDIQKVEKELTQLVKIYGGKYLQQKEYKTSTREEPVENRMDIPVHQEIMQTIESMKRPHSIDLIAIGISTGGPRALREVLPYLDSNMNIPIIVVQHMPAGFTYEFAKSLNRITTLDVKEAEDGDLLKNGRILISPGDKHLEVAAKPLANVVKLTDQPPVNGHRPSVDVMFRSVSEVYKNNCIAVIMTGMGKDGAREIGSIRKEGGITLAQDSESCVVAGMPRVAVQYGFIEKVVELKNMAETINHIVAQYNRQR
ncbi:MAG: chemotaxis response regulator protein-glutamate methylesterase [Spirochaetales bacterium]|nr:chemotaxis response regulator protein-glutamate methylesterase [Spirochaetales bacterium]